MAYGDIGAAVDTLEFDLTDITWPDMVHVAGSIYAIAYTDADGDGMVITVDIAANGQIGAAIIDSLEFDANDGAHPSIVHVAGEIFAIAYRGVDADGFVVTVNITAAGVITAVSGGSLEFETTACYEPDLIKVPDGSGVFAIVCRGNANQGIITTVSITDAGAISLIANEEAWATNVNNPQICHVAGNIFAIVYRDNAFDGWVCTIEISPAGAISATVEDTLEFDTIQGTDPSICKTLGDIFVIAYRGTGDDGFAVTVEISAAGAIGATVEDTLEFDAVNAAWPDIIHLGRGICAIAYGGDGNDGWVCTIQTHASGLIDNTIIDSEEIDGVYGTHPSIVRVSGNQYAVSYIGVGSDGFVKTPTIETPPSARHLLLMGVG